MLHRVACPVFLASRAADTVVGKGAAPHYISARTIVLRVGHHLGRFLDYGLENPFRNPVGDLNIRGVGKISFKNVRHHVRHTARGLIVRQGERQLRVHEGEPRAQRYLGADADLMEAVEFCNHGVARTFTACRGNSKHNPDGERRLYFTLTAIKVPEITGVGSSGGNSFRGIDSASAPDGEESLEAIFAHNADAFVNAVVGGIRLDAAQFTICDSGLIERVLYPCEQT